MVAVFHNKIILLLIVFSLFIFNAKSETVVVVGNGDYVLGVNIRNETKEIIKNETIIVYLKYNNTTLSGYTNTGSLTFTKISPGNYTIWINYKNITIEPIEFELTRYKSVLTIVLYVVNRTIFIENEVFIENEKKETREDFSINIENEDLLFVYVIVFTSFIFGLTVGILLKRR